jgi:hypothetical protein
MLLTSCKTQRLQQRPNHCNNLVNLSAAPSYKIEPLTIAKSPGEIALKP